ncbi:MAG TPA: XdhC/CoxI family protein [Gaiellaceae bacterium]|nr:XdhC/CoxI family protein [Gaiellaceae bacterium]
MKDIVETLEKWTEEGATVALGSVVERVGSAPRDPGAALAVSSSREIAGGVTGGCVEPMVIREANEVLGGAPGRLVEYGLDDSDGFEAGLTCGGRIAVAVYRLDPALVPTIAEAVRTDRPIAVTVSLDDDRFGEQTIYTDDGCSNRGVSPAARSLLELGENAVVELPDGEKVFVESYAPRPNMYIFGASDHVSALVPLAKMLGYRVTVCDPRRAFLTRERFPDADELSSDWHADFLAGAPIDSRTAICMMTHNVGYDVPVLELAFASNAGYIGAIGSEKSRAERNAKLRERGIGDAELARLHAPIGIQIGARTPEEVAITIAAQLIEANVVARAKRISAIARATVLS